MEPGNGSCRWLRHSEVYRSSRFGFDTYSIASSNLGTGLGLPLSTPVLSPAVTLQISKAASPNPVVTGSNLIYTLSYSNTGGSTATSVVVQDPIPSGTTFVSATAGGALNGGAVVWNLGALVSGASGSVSMVVKVTAAGGSSVTNSGYSISSAQTATVLGSPVTTQVTSPPPPTPLTLTLSADRASVVSGTILTYQIAYSNPGTDTKTGVIVTDPVPAGAVFVAATNGGVLTSSGVQWTLGSLLPTAAGSLYYQVLVTAPAGQTLTNLGATVTATGLNPVTTGPLATPVVSSPASLRLAITAAPSPVLLNGTLTYTITYANDGPATVSNAVLTDPLPEGTSFSSATNGGILSNGIVTWAVGTLPAGSQGSVAFTVLAASPAGATIINSGSRLLGAGGERADGPTVLTDVALTEPVFDGGVTTDKPVYAASEIVHETGTIRYVSGGAGITSGLLALLETIAPSGVILQSGTSVLSDLTVGSTRTQTADWPTSTSPSGVYTVRFTVTAPSGAVLLQSSTTFTLDVPDARGVVGAIEASNSPVAQGVPLNAHVTMSNGSATGYGAFPLEVKLVDPATLSVISSVPISTPLAAGATVLLDQPFSTSELAAQDYRLWLTTTSNGGRLLAIADATVVHPGIALTPATQTIEAGLTGSITLTMTGPQSTPTTFPLSSSDPSIASVPASVTVPANAVTQPFDVQAVIVGGPITVTAAIPSSLGGGTATCTVEVSPSETIQICLLSLSVDAEGVLSIHGQGLMKVTQVEFNATCARGVGTIVPQSAFLTQTETKITLIPPTGSSGQRVILVNPAGGSSSCSTEAYFANSAVIPEEAELAADLARELGDLRAIAAGNDLQAIDRAWTEWNAIQSIEARNTTSIIDILRHLLALVADLRETSLDTTRAERLANRLFSVLQNEAEELNRREGSPR